MDEINESTDDYWFAVRLLIRHPNADPALISSTLADQSAHGHMVGTPRMTPKGTPLPGVYPKSSWTGFSRIVEGEKSFTTTILDVVHRLEPHRDFLNDLQRSGGHLELILSISGTESVADSMDFDLLQRIGALGIGLGIDIYPARLGTSEGERGTVHSDHGV